jgi:type II secretory pathway predicted ATPase ExeA
VSLQQLAQVFPVSCAGKKPESPFITHSHRTALDELASVFARAEPLAILIGEGKAGASYVIRRFLAGIVGDVTVVRITEPCSDAIAATRKLIRALGFEAKDLTLNDLQNVVTLFLSHQKAHHRRTVICIEEAQDNGQWISDEVSRLVELQTQGNFGLMVIVSGRRGLQELLNAPPMDALVTPTTPRIGLAPFSLAETREYIRWRIESGGTVNIAQVFEFDAITLIHELCAGAPDKVRALCLKCMQLMGEEDAALVTTDLVDKAKDFGRPATKPEPADAEPGSVKVNGSSPRGGRLVTRMNGELVLERALDGGHILIGRDKLCDIRLAGPAVSRHHALLVNASDGVAVIDIGSTNGTFVDGRKIRHYALQDSGEIAVGNYLIEYVAGDDRADWVFDINHTNTVLPHKVDSATLNLKTLHGGNGKGSDDQHGAPAVCLIKGNINRNGEKIYHAPGTPSYDLTRIDESKGERWFCSEDEATAAGWRAPRK